MDREKVLQFWSDFYDHALKQSEISCSYQECFPTKNDSIYKQLVFKRLDECRGSNLSDDELRNLQLFIENSTLEFDEKSLYKTVPNAVKAMILRVIQFLYSLGFRAWIKINFSLAGVYGKTILKLPGRLYIKRCALIRAALLFFLTFLFYSMLYQVFMTGGGGELWKAVSQFLGDTGGSSSTPNPGQDPTGSSNLLVAAVAGDQPQSSEESWLKRLLNLPTPASSEEAEGPIQQLPSLEPQPQEVMDQAAPAQRSTANELRRIAELEKDDLLGRSFKNAEINGEKIIIEMKEKTAFSDEEIRVGVENAIDAIREGPDVYSNNSKIKKMLNELRNEELWPQSAAFRKIVNEINTYKNNWGGGDGGV
nr:hypothetical protein [Ferula sinkiangensis]UEK21295.1 hypothetical protein [Ferula sinkiangensis]